MLFRHTLEIETCQQTEHAKQRTVKESNESNKTDVIQDRRSYILGVIKRRLRVMAEINNTRNQKNIERYQPYQWHP